MDLISRNKTPNQYVDHADGRFVSQLQYVRITFNYFNIIFYHHKTRCVNVPNLNYTKCITYSIYLSHLHYMRPNRPTQSY